MILKKYEHIPPDRRVFPIRRESFSHTLKAACERAGVTPFVPNEMRNAAATHIRDTFGIENAQATLGHSQPSMTAKYSSKTDKLAAETAAAVG